MDSLNLSPEQNTPSDTGYEFYAQAKSGANWFYWIAGLSVVNSLIFIFGGDWSFFAGLGITQVIDAIAFGITQNRDLAPVKIIAFVIDLVIAGIFFGCGYFSNQLKVWAFIMGMVLYLLDGIILLLVGMYLPAAFHVFALFMIFRGLSAARQINSFGQPNQ